MTYSLQDSFRPISSDFPKHSSIMVTMSHPAALLVGTSPNIGVAVANALLANGYRLAPGSRMLADKTTSDGTLHKARVE